MKKGTGRWLVLSWLVLGLAQIEEREATAAFTFLDPGFTQVDIAVGFPADAPPPTGNGPNGIVVLPNGDLIVSNVLGGVYVVPTSSGPVSVTPAMHASPTACITGMAMADNGVIYGDCQNENGIRIVTPTGVVTNTGSNYGHGAAPFGMCSDPRNGRILIGDRLMCGADIYDPPTNDASGFVNQLNFFLGGAIDGIATTCSGSYILLADGIYGVIKIDRTVPAPYPASILATLPAGSGSADGIAIGRPGTPLDGYAFVNTTGGFIYKVDISSGALTTFASGGSRGDFIATDGQGNLYATQTDRVVKISPVSSSGSFVFAGGNVCDSLLCSIDAACACAGSNQNICISLRDQLNEICSEPATNPGREHRLEALANRLQTYRTTGQIAICP